jgi:hypothetical protein
MGFIINFYIWVQSGFVENCQSQARLKPKRCLGGFIFTL